MKIISPSATIIEHALEKLTLPERIEQCGRICYKSEDRIKPGSAEPFCEKVIKRGHNSVIEMATLSMLVKADQETLSDFLSLLISVESMKFLKISVASGESLLVTGSVRTFRDLYNNEQAFRSGIVRGLYRKINFMDGHPVSRKRGSQPLKTWVDLNAVAILEDSDWESMLATDPLMYAKHKYVAVKFIVNRAISHELVRHRPCSFLQESQRYVKMNGNVTFIQPSAFFASDSEAILNWERAMQVAEDDYNFSVKYGCSPQEARLVLPNSTKTELICYTNLDEWKHIFSQRDNKAADPAMREVMGPLHEEFRKEWPGVFGVPVEEEINQ